MSMNLTSHVELYDSDLIAIERGPLEWMKAKQMTRVDLEGFRRAVVDQFGSIGFRVEVKVFETDQADVYAFDVEIREKLGRKEFDYDRMVHEVTHNILELPDQDGGVIKADEALARMVREERFHGKHKH